MAAREFLKGWVNVHKGDFMSNKITVKWRPFIIVTILILTLVFLGGKGRWILFYDSSIEGYVVDGETGKPLGNVIVAGLWQISQFMSQGFGGYAKIILVETDREGKFRLPAWLTFKPWTFSGSMRDYAPQIIIYKPGYKLLYTGREALIDYDKTMLPASEKELNKQLQVNQRIDPARLMKIYTDEERLQNYDDWHTYARFPRRYYSKKQLRIIFDALENELGQISDKNERKNHVLKSNKQLSEFWLGGAKK